LRLSAYRLVGPGSKSLDRGQGKSAWERAQGTPFTKPKEKERERSSIDRDFSLKMRAATGEKK